ncbi:hypothetical protein [Streptomyces sp. bgisy032]|uniref:hypothetical protein n=1 Tax=Streptomyces sp. bgisy032 TaxID=3413773 RepID=UPI003D7373B7
MSKPFDYADGATGGEPQGPPNVYLPQGAPPPAYDAYPDPAAAHGWQDVYDSADPAAGGSAAHPGGGAHGADGAGDPHTLPYPGAPGDPHASPYSGAPGHPHAPLPSGAPGYPHPGGPDDPGAASGGTGADGIGETRELPVVAGVPVVSGVPGAVAAPAPSRSGAGRGARRKPRPWHSRRVAVAAGAVGALSAAVLIAGFSFSDSSSGGTRGGEDGRTGSSSKESPAVTPTGTGTAAASDAPLVAGPEDSGEPSGGASASPSAEGSRSPSPSASDDAAPPPSGEPTTSAPAAPAPTTTTTAAPPGRADGKPGHGPGGTKGPK